MLRYLEILAMVTIEASTLLIEMIFFNLSKIYQKKDVTYIDFSKNEFLVQCLTRTEIGDFPISGFEQLRGRLVL